MYPTFFCLTQLARSLPPLQAERGITIYAISQLPLGCNRFSFNNGHCLYVFPGCDT